jgi:hypothetical protein
MMGIACGVLHWPPPVFWVSTAHELFASIEAHQAANGASDDDGGEEISTATRSLYDALKEQEDANGRG